MKKIKEEKEKNIWAVQIMDELLHRAYEYPYENNGMKPQTSTPHKDETMPHNNSNGGDEIALGRNGLNPQSISQKDDETAISWDYEECDNQNIGNYLLVLASMHKLTIFESAILTNCMSIAW